MMFGWGSWADGGWLAMLISSAIWVVFVGVIVWAIVRALAGPRAQDGSSAPRRADDPEEILRGRFARGEITAQEFEERLAVLRRTR